jgi:hypothetical protein
MGRKIVKYQNLKIIKTTHMAFLGVQWVLETILKNCLGLSWAFGEKWSQNFQPPLKF